MTAPVVGAVPAGVGTAPIHTCTSSDEAREIFIRDECARRGHLPLTEGFGRHAAYAAAVRPVICRCGAYLWSAVQS